MTYEVTPEHQRQVRELISDLALKLRADQEWQPKKGEQCDRCGYQRHCPALHTEPEPLPETAKPLRKGAAGVTDLK